MTNIEYIFEFANKHNFPKTDCEVMFNAINDGRVHNIYEHDADIVSVKFDKSLVENEMIKMEDIRFDIDSDLPDDVFFAWQKDNPEMSFRGWIGLGRYVPTLIENSEFLDELDILTKDIEMKLSQLFPKADDVGDSDGDSDYDDDYDEEEDDDGD